MIPHECPKRELLAAYCKKWGGRLTRLSEERFDTRFDAIHGPPNRSWYDAPFTGGRLGVLWRKKEIIYAGDEPWPGILHEMGHVFAAKRNPSLADEYNFLGWEHVMAHVVGDVKYWREHNANYGVTDSDGDPTDFSLLEEKEFQWLMDAREKLATERGLLDSKRNPQAIR
jgi:hypothetical protein